MHFTFSRRYRGPIQGVILDWAGTTVDHGSCAPAKVFVDLFQRHGVDVRMEHARGPMGLAKKDHIRAILKLEEVSARWLAVRGRGWTEADVHALYEEFIPLQIAVLARHAEVIPGVVETVSRWRERGLKIGATTGYNRAMMDVLEPEAARRGYVPDVSVTVSEVPAGRPEPWMALHAAREMRCFPMEALVKIGDTRADIDEGLNAGMWTIGITRTGNELGVDLDGLGKIPPAQLAGKLAAARDRFLSAGAHFTATSVADCEPILDVISARLQNGERP